jgi:hypothetical protein
MAISNACAIGCAHGLDYMSDLRWARGNVQYDTYLYSGGFSFTSTVCAPASVAVIPGTAKPATSKSFSRVYICYYSENRIVLK